MKTHTFVIGYALALALLLFAQRHPEASPPAGFRYVVDLTRSAESQDPATGLDAPARFASNLWTVDQIPPERLVAPLVVLDVSAQVKHDSSYQVSVEDIARWEHANGQMPLGAVVIARTGWDSHDDKSAPHFPGYSLDAARFLVEGRSALGLGIDTLGIDHGPSGDFPVRQYALAHSVYSLENVANLDRTPSSGASVVVAPLKMKGSSGPVRVLALVR